MFRSLVLLVVLGIGFAPARDLSAQLWQAPAMGDEVVTFSLQGGALTGGPTYPDGSSLGGGLALGGSVAVWASSRIGLRGTFLATKVEGEGGTQTSASPIALLEPRVRFGSAEVLLRQPMAIGSMEGAPYLALGLGWKTYRWDFGSLDPDTLRALVGGAGYELRLGGGSPLGGFAELRLHRSNFDLWGFDTAHNDLVLAAGVTLSR